MTSRRLRHLAAADLDHVGLVGRELMPLMQAFDRLGFSVTEPRLLMRRDPASGERQSLEQTSCHAVFERGYVELSAVHSRASTHHLAAYLDRDPALRIVALGTRDVLKSHAAAVRGKLAPTPPALASRDISYGAMQGEARFRWFMLAPDQAPEGLLCVVRNLTPELVYQREVQRHPNGAVALRGITICVDDLESAAARYAVLFGGEPVRPGGSDRIREFPLANQWLRLATPAALRDRYPSAVLPPAPCCVGFTVAVKSVAKAAALLGGNDVAYQRSGPDRIWTSVPAAGGTIVELRGEEST